MSFCRLHGYGPNGIGMRRGANYKVLSTTFNIMGQVSLIRQLESRTHVTVLGLSNFSHLGPFEPRPGRHRQASGSAVSRSTAIATAATPLPLLYMCVCISSRT